MNRFRKSLAILVIFSIGGSCLSAKVFSIDSRRVLQESREGRSILASTDKERKAVMDLEYKESQKIAKLREDIESAMRSGKLVGDDIQDKYEELGKAQRKAKYVLESAREDFKVSEQKKVMAFRNKMHKLAGEFFKKQGCSMVFDKGAPGIMYVSTATDKTDTLIKELDANYKKENAKLALTKSGNKKA